MQNTEPKEVSEIVAEVMAGLKPPAATNFYNWLAKCAEDPADDPAGDFATDAAADSFFPRNIDASAAGFAAVFNYLYFNRRANADVIEAFIECWQMFYKDATGASWIDNGYKK